MVRETLPSKKNQSGFQDQKTTGESTSFPGILLAHLPDAVVATDEAFRIVYINPAAEAMFGWAGDEVLGRPVLELFRLASRGENSLFESGLEVAGVTCCRRDGTCFDAHIRSTAMQGPNGKWIGWVTTVQEQIRELKKSEDRIRAMVDGNPLIIWVTDADGKNEFVNQAYREFFGVTTEQVLSDGWQVLVHPVDSAGYVEAFVACLRERKPFHAQVRMQRWDGEWRWVDSQGQPRFSDHGDFLGLSGSALDITESRRRAKNAEFIADISADFARLSTPHEIMEVVGEKIYQRYGLTRLTFTYVNEAADLVTSVYDRHAPDLPSGLGDLRLSDFIDEPYLTEFKAGRTVVVQDHRTDPRTVHKAQTYRRFGVVAQLLAPFVSGGEWHFVITLQKGEPYAWRPDEIELLEELAPHIYYCLERAKAEESLRASESRYRGLYESMDEGFMVSEVLFDENDRPVDILYHEVNPAAIRMLGMDYTGRRLTEIDPSFEPYWFEIWGRVARTGIGERMERYAEPLKSWYSLYVFRLGDEGSHFVANVFEDITDQKQTQAALLESRHDLERRVQERTEELRHSRDKLQAEVEERKRAEATFRESEERFRALVQASAQVLYRASPDWSEMRLLQGGNFLTNTDQPNPNWLNTYIHPDDQGWVWEVIQNAVRSGKTYELEHRVVRADGTLGWIASRAVPVRNEAGEIIEWFGAASDITDRKRAEEVLNQAYAELDERVKERTAELANANVRLQDEIEKRKQAEEEIAVDLRDTRLLHELSERLVSEGNFAVLYQEILTAAITLMQGDAGTIQILDHATHELVLITTQGFERTMTEHYHRIDASSKTSCGIAMATGERVFVDFDNPASEDPDGSLRMHLEAGYRSAQSTPLITRSGHPVGMISTHWHHHHRSSERELRFLDLLARQAADLIERAQAESALKAAAARDAFRVRLSDALRPLGDPVNIQAEACRLLGEYLGVDQALYAEVEEDGKRARVERVYHASGAQSAAGWDLGSSFGAGLVENLAAGHTLAVPDVEKVADLTDVERAVYARLQIRSYVAVPLVKAGRFQAVLTIPQNHPHVWTEDEVAVIEETAERTWAAVERARVESALRSSEQRFRSSVENLNEAFLMMSAVREDGAIVDFRYEYVNQTACQMIHRTPDQVLGHTLHELSPESITSGLYDQYVQVVETGRPIQTQDLCSTCSTEQGQSLIEWVFDVRAGKFGDGIIMTANDVTEQVRLSTEHQQAVQQHEIHRRLAEQREKERQSYARDIHDGPIQSLSSLVFNLQILKEGYSDPTLQLELSQLTLGLKEAIQELRQVMNELRPPTVMHFGLAKAIQAHTENLRERYPRVSWNLNLANDGRLLPEQTCLAMFRIYQEAVNNIIRHSEASKAWIQYQLEKDAVFLEIRDNGKGFAEKQDIVDLTSHQHFGLAGISERVEAIGGELQIRTKPGHGTSIRVRVPIEPREENTKR